MKKNETQFYINTNFAKNNSIKLKCGKSKNNRNSRNSFLKIKNKISSKFKLFTNSTIYNNLSKETSNKNEELPKNDINYIYDRKSILSNSISINKIFFKRISAKNQNSKIFRNKTYYKKNNDNFISTQNLSEIKNIKKDSFIQKFLSQQKNDFNRYQRKDYVFSSFYSRDKNANIKNIKKYFINSDKSSKFDLVDLNMRLIMDRRDSFSICSFEKCKNIQNKTNSLIKKSEKKYKINKRLKKSNESLSRNKDSNLIKEKNVIEESKENEINDNYQENNISSEEEKINGDIYYNKYLKDISSSDSKKYKCKEKNLSKTDERTVIKNLKILKNKLSLYGKNEIFQYTKRLNKYKYPFIINKNNKKLFEFKKYDSTERKNVDYSSKNVVIENLYLRKKLMFEKNSLI